MSHTLVKGKDMVRNAHTIVVK